MASRIKPLTALDVQRLTVTAFVGGVPGLQLVVSPGGTKAWRLFYRLPSSKRRRSMSLGRFPSLSLADARKTANEMLAQASAGTDPKAARTEKVEIRDLSVAIAIDRYLSWCETNNASKTVRSKRSAIKTHFLPACGSTPLIDLSRRQIASLIDGLSDKPATRRQLYLYISHFLNWCLGRELIETNPIIGLQAPRPVETRERVLSDDEVVALSKAEGTIATIAKLCLLTAQRKGSIEEMRWDQLDFNRKSWTVPGKSMKSGKLHVVPLSPPALALLKDWPRLKGPFVFGVGTDGQKPFAGTSRAMKNLRQELGDVDWRLHDLRRTAVTLAQRRACSLDAIRALTQHKLSGVIGIYARHGFEAEKANVVEAIAKEWNDLVSKTMQI
ncbi:MAG: integrase arm-type DNA-binding domain-containing protein [Henriciella sp.]|nr:integrase arm-type DNA-binding domain-containing protein [Henriciella sp.]